MTTKRRTGIGIPYPMFPTPRDVERAMHALDEDTARRNRAPKTAPEPATLCGWCNEPADLSLDELLGEAFCAEHSRAAQQEAALNGGVLVTLGRRQKDALGKAKSRALEQSAHGKRAVPGSGADETERVGPIGNIRRKTDPGRP
jgi:hypothetical protein